MNLDVCLQENHCGNNYKCEWLRQHSSYLCFCENNFLVLNRNCTNAGIFI